MVIFCSDKNILNMLCNKYCNRRIKIFNMSSYFSNPIYIDASSLVKLTSMIQISNNNMINFVSQDKMFDMYYADLILNNKECFMTFMNIMSSSFEGDICIILVYRDNYRDAIMESLIKLIQQRYHYNCWIVEDIDDIEILKESTSDTIGLMCLFNDCNKFDQMNNYNINAICIE